jgi:hypothetical protein
MEMRKKFGISDSYFDLYNKRKSIYGKEDFGDINVKVINV